MRLEAKSSRIDVEKINRLSKVFREPSQRRRESVALSPRWSLKGNRQRKWGDSSFLFGVFFFLVHSLLGFGGFCLYFFCRDNVFRGSFQKVKCSLFLLLILLLFSFSSSFVILNLVFLPDFFFSSSLPPFPNPLPPRAIILSLISLF